MDTTGERPLCSQRICSTLSSAVNISARAFVRRPSQVRSAACRTCVTEFGRRYRCFVASPDRGSSQRARYSPKSQPACDNDISDTRRPDNAATSIPVGKSRQAGARSTMGRRGWAPKLPEGHICAGYSLSKEPSSDAAVPGACATTVCRIAYCTVTTRCCGASIGHILLWTRSRRAIAVPIDVSANTR